MVGRSENNPYVLVLLGESNSSKIPGLTPYVLAPSLEGPLPVLPSLLVTHSHPLVPPGLAHSAGAPGAVPLLLPPHLCSASCPDIPDGGLGLSAPIILSSWVRGRLPCCPSVPKHHLSTCPLASRAMLPGPQPCCFVADPSLAPSRTGGPRAPSCCCHPSKWLDLIEPCWMPPNVTLLSLTTLMVAQGERQLARQEARTQRVGVTRGENDGRGGRMLRPSVQPCFVRAGTRAPPQDRLQGAEGPGPATSPPEPRAPHL